MGGTGEDDQNVFNGCREEGSALYEEEDEEEEVVEEDSSVHRRESDGRIHAAAK